MRALIREDDLVLAHPLARAQPDAPSVRGVAQNPDAFFQAREASNPFHNALPEIVQEVVGEFAERTGRQYDLVEYQGAPEAERVVVIMGQGRRSPRDRRRASSPAARRSVTSPCGSTARSRSRTSRRRCRRAQHIAVLDRTKEPGAPAEPLFLDTWPPHPDGQCHVRPGERPTGHRRPLRPVVQGVHPADGEPALHRARSRNPKRRFTVGIVDDVTHLSLDPDPRLRCAAQGGLGGLLRPRLRTAPWARTRTRSRSSATAPTCLPRGTSCSTREVRWIDRLAPEVRPGGDPLDLSGSSRLT